MYNFYEHVMQTLSFSSLGDANPFSSHISQPLYSSRLYAQKPVFEIVHEESVKVYLHTRLLPYSTRKATRRSAEPTALEKKGPVAFSL